eukprot:scaffold90043_cov25-Tisochrysis_lutea.AAC.2
MALRARAGPHCPLTFLRGTFAHTANPLTLSQVRLGPYLPSERFPSDHLPLLAHFDFCNLEPPGPHRMRCVPPRIAALPIATSGPAASAGAAPAVLAMPPTAAEKGLLPLPPGIAVAVSAAEPAPADVMSPTSAFTSVGGWLRERLTLDESRRPQRVRSLDAPQDYKVTSQLVRQVSALSLRAISPPAHHADI